MAQSPKGLPLRLSLITAGAAAMLVACSGLQLRGGDTPMGSGDRQLPPPTTAVPSRQPVDSEVRRVCRNDRPRGWIAIDFVADSTRCASSPGRRYTMALVINHERQPFGREIEVCFGERIPSNWTRVRDVAEPGRCPSDSPNADPNQHTVTVIRRSR